MGGSYELVECFCWGAVAEGGSGAVARLVGDGVEVGMVAGDWGSFGKVAGGALDQGRACAGPVLADNQVAFPVARDFPTRNVRALQLTSRIPTIWGFASACWGFLGSS